MYISGPRITISLTSKTQDHVLIAGFARKWHLYMCFILFWHMRIKELEFFLFKLIECVNWNVLILFCCFHDQKALQLVILLKICFKSLDNPDGEYFDPQIMVVLTVGVHLWGLERGVLICTECLEGPCRRDFVDDTKQCTGSRGSFDNDDTGFLACIL